MLVFFCAVAISSIEVCEQSNMATISLMVMDFKNIRMNKLGVTIYKEKVVKFSLMVMVKFEGW